MISKLKCFSLLFLVFLTVKTQELNFLEEDIAENMLSIFLSKDGYMNMTDYSVNSLLYLVPKYVNLDMRLDNKTQNDFGLTIDTTGLKLLIPELGQYPKNYEMYFRIYLDNENARPYIMSQIDGTSVYLNFGMDFGINDTDDPNAEYKLIINIDLSAYLLLEYTSAKGTLPLYINTIKLRDVDINPNNVLKLDKAKLLISINAFLKMAVNLVNKMVTEIDVITLLNNKTGMNYTSLDIDPEFGYLEIALK